MKKHISVLSLVVFCCMLALLLASCGGGGSGSSAFAKPDGGNGDGSGNGGVAEGTLKWSFQADGPVNSSPAVSCDGTIYVGSDDGTLSAVNPDGTIKWKYVTGGSIVASPSVSEDCSVVYVGSLDRQLYAIRADGTLKWVLPTKSKFTASSAIGSDGTIYAAGTHQDRPVYCFGELAIRAGFLYAVTPEGVLKWSVMLSGEVTSSPAIAADGTIYIASTGEIEFDRVDPCDKESNYLPSSVAPNIYPANSHLYAFTPNGALKWRFGGIGDFNSSPSIGSDGTIYIGSDFRNYAYGEEKNKIVSYSATTEGYLYAISPDGILKWLVDLYGDVDSSPAIANDGTIYVGSDKHDVFAVNPNGTIRWSFPTRNDVNSSPAIGDDGTIYVGSDDGFLYALNPNGTEKWRYEEGGAIGSSPTIISNGIIYVGSASGNLIAVGGKGTVMNSPWPKFRRDLKNHARQ
jgi:outer membrane protein assembly factor BamB